MLSLTTNKENGITSFKLQHEKAEAEVTFRTNHKKLPGAYNEMREFVSALKALSAVHQQEETSFYSITPISHLTFKVKFGDHYEAFVSRFDDNIKDFGATIQELRIFPTIEKGYTLGKCIAHVMDHDIKNGTYTLPRGD
jgi:hypothetical protein